MWGGQGRKERKGKAQRKKKELNISTYLIVFKWMKYLLIVFILLIYFNINIVQGMLINNEDEEIIEIKIKKIK